MIDMSLDIIPAKIAHYVVLKYDPKTNSIDLGDIKIKITEDKIHEVLGIQKDGIDLDSIKDCEPDNEELKQWYAQDPKVSKTMQPLCDLLEQTDEADEMFVINFLTLFINSIIEKTTSGATETRHIPKLIALEDKSTVNWCKYLNNCLKNSKSIWKPNSNNSYYAGPLPFLVVSTI